MRLAQTTRRAWNRFRINENRWRKRKNLCTKIDPEKERQTEPIVEGLCWRTKKQRFSINKQTNNNKKQPTTDINKIHTHTVKYARMSKIMKRWWANWNGPRAIVRQPTTEKKSGSHSKQKIYETIRIRLWSQFRELLNIPNFMKPFLFGRTR